MTDFLLDTHVFIWLDVSSRKISACARELLQDSSHRLYLSGISAWEIGQKYMQGKLPLVRPPDRFMTECRAEYGIEALPFDENAALHITKLPLLHGDPFDRMLVCQAIQHNLTIITGDRMIQQYPIKTVW